MSRPDRWMLQAEHGQYGGEGVRQEEAVAGQGGLAD